MNNLQHGFPMLTLTQRAIKRTQRAFRETRSAQHRHVEDYLATHFVRKLHLGAGSGPLPGWLNTDLVVYHEGVVHLDATKPFPIPTGSFDYVYGEHLIEHLPLPKAVGMLQECARILRDGGKVRFATPPLETIMALYRTPVAARTDEQIRCLAWAIATWLPEEWKGITGVTAECLVLNCQFRNWGHQFLYDRASLEGLLESAGFDTTWHAMGESDDPHLRAIEQHGRIMGNDDLVAFTTMCIEGS